MGDIGPAQQRYEVLPVREPAGVPAPPAPVRREPAPVTEQQEPAPVPVSH